MQDFCNTALQTWKITRRFKSRSFLHRVLQNVKDLVELCGALLLTNGPERFWKILIVWGFFLFCFFTNMRLNFLALYVFFNNSRPAVNRFIVLFVWFFFLKVFLLNILSNIRYTFTIHFLFMLTHPPKNNPHLLHQYTY